MKTHSITFDVTADEYDDLLAGLAALSHKRDDIAIQHANWSLAALQQGNEATAQMHDEYRIQFNSGVDRVENLRDRIKRAALAAKGE